MRLKGSKVILRPIVMDDAKRFVQWFKDPHVTKFLTRGPITMAEERKWIRSLAKEGRHRRIFAIDTLEGTHIGSIGFHEISKRDKCGEFGIVVGDRNYWNKGYGTDALCTLLDYGFTKLKLHRVSLKVYVYNPRAIHVYKRLGFKREGIAREAVRYQGKYYDEYIMGLLITDWRSLGNK
jgi:RimJ/RimL family protein N-acetyltransferase